MHRGNLKFLTVLREETALSGEVQADFLCLCVTWHQIRLALTQCFGMMQKQVSWGCLSRVWSRGEFGEGVQVFGVRFLLT